MGDLGAVNSELNTLLAYAKWVGLAACVGGLYMIWWSWRSMGEMSDSLKRVGIIIACAGVISTAVGVAQWLV